MHCNIKRTYRYYGLTRYTDSVSVYNMSAETVRPPLVSYQGQCAAICGKENLEALTDDSTSGICRRLIKRSAGLFLRRLTSR
jgi:hypothetical protein